MLAKSADSVLCHHAPNRPLARVTILPGDVPLPAVIIVTYYLLNTYNDFHYPFHYYPSYWSKSHNYHFHQLANHPLARVTIMPGDVPLLLYEQVILVLIIRS